MTGRGKRPEPHKTSPPGADAPSAGARLARRQQAERLLREKAMQFPEDIAALSPEATRKLLHELRVHQIELEMQNEELREAQLALDAARARYFDLYDLAPVGYCTVSEEGLILHANLNAASLLGLTRDALANKPLHRFIAKADQDIYYRYRKLLVDSGKQQSCELRMVKHDDTQFWAHLETTAAKEADGAFILRVTLSDVTVRKQVDEDRALFEQVLQDKNIELERARSVAEQANLAKSNFLSSMSHELRTPLNAILGFAQLIESGSPPPTPSQKRSLAQILKGGWYLLELINEILDLALIESGRATLSREAMTPGELLLECRAMMETQAEQRGIELTFPQLKIPYFVSADRTRLKQILINLLSNAIKYNKTGGTVIVECRLSPPDSLRISVRDSGEGLTAMQLQQLFQPFNRLGKETGAEEGTGIGLVVTKRLVELMGGRIGAESIVGVGSVFWIDLRLADAPQIAVDPAPGAAPIRSPVAQGASPSTVLYVEDNPANLELVEQLIARRNDLRLISATDAHHGIELTRTQQPALILMDINLPGMSGIEAMTILRAGAATAHIPIIALSANAVPLDIEKALAAGFFDYLTKPIEVERFMEALEGALAFVQSQATGAAKDR